MIGVVVRRRRVLGVYEVHLVVQSAGHGHSLIFVQHLFISNNLFQLLPSVNFLFWQLFLG